MDNGSRRDFLKTAGMAAASPAGAAQGAREKGFRRSSFRPSSTPRPITDNLYVLEDTCNVYLIRRGSKALVIDFGSGRVLEHLSALGVARLDWVLHTHHHRDQCQGDWKAAERKIPIAVPQHERHLFAEARNFWRNRRVFHLYYVRNDFNTVTEDIPVARILPDYSTFTWEGIDFHITPTPGHTLGSITLLATIDGKKTAFTGDLMYAPGKILNLYDTQINYAGLEGIDLGVYSLARLREHNPELLCPSHGEILADPADALRETQDRLTRYYRFQTGNSPATEEGRPYVVSPHLICSPSANSTFYTIISDSGKAMFIDYGSASWNSFGVFERATPVGGRMRFIEHNIGRLKSEYGMRSVDVAMPSHMHDDHMNGFPHLKEHYGTKVWCYENMVDIFQRPRGYNLGCILGEPFKVDRSFRHGEKFKWEEFEFEITHSPGHTEYQMALFAEIDGNRVAFTGDAFFPDQRNEGIMRHNLIFRNHVENDSHLKSIRNLIEHEPGLICPGHGRAYPVDREIMLSTEQMFRQQQQWFFDLLPEGEVDFGLDPSWVRIDPYQILLGPGEQHTIQIRAQNYYAEPMELEIALIVPTEWRIEPEIIKIKAEANSTAAAPVRIRVPKDWDAPGVRFAIAADVIRNGKYLGQITEAVVELRGALGNF